MSNKSEELRLQGNECVKAGKYTEAVLHYTHALDTDRQNHLIYSNRSLAFLKLQQYYLAMQDANTTIRLQPKWPKGYFRKGEVEFQAGHYQSALLSYGQAMILDPSNEEVRKTVANTNTLVQDAKKKEQREPWVFCGGGSFIGLLIVMADTYLADKPSIQNVVLQVLLVTVFGCLGFLVLLAYRHLRQSDLKSRLEPPVNLMEAMGQQTSPNSEHKVEAEDASQTTNHRTYRKGGMGAARQRFKKGKT